MKKLNDLISRTSKKNMNTVIETRRDGWTKISIYLGDRELYSSEWHSETRVTIGRAIKFIKNYNGVIFE